jgi:hypothetical protein
MTLAMTVGATKIRILQEKMLTSLLKDDDKEIFTQKDDPVPLDKTCST